MKEAPEDDMLESMFETKLRDSGKKKNKTTCALYNQDKVENEPPSYTRAKEVRGPKNEESKLGCQ